MPIGIGQMEVPLSPGAILRWGRRAPCGEHGLIERIDIVNAKDRTAPPGRAMARREGEIDQSIPSLEGTEARLRPAIDQREAECSIEGNSLGHGPYGEGHGTDVVDHERSTSWTRTISKVGKRQWASVGACHARCHYQSLRLP